MSTYRVLHAVYEEVTNRRNRIYIGFILERISDGRRRLFVPEEAGALGFNDGGISGYTPTEVPILYPYYRSVLVGLLPDGGVPQLDAIALPYTSIGNTPVSQRAQEIIDHLNNVVDGRAARKEAYEARKAHLESPEGQQEIKQRNEQINEIFRSKGINF